MGFCLLSMDSTVGGRRRPPLQHPGQTSPINPRCLSRRRRRGPLRGEPGKQDLFAALTQNTWKQSPVVTHTPGTHLLHREKQEGGPWPEMPLLSQACPLPLETVWGRASSWSSHRRLGSGAGMMLAWRALLSAIQPGALSQPMLFWGRKKMGSTPRAQG